MARRKTSTFEDIVKIASVLPWWAGFSLAIVSFLVLHSIAGMEHQQAASGQGLFNSVWQQLFKGLAMVCQVLVPMALALGSIFSLIKARKRKNLFDNAANDQEPELSTTSGKPDAIGSMSWRQFEMLISEFFRRQGYSVAETEGGADGGVDLRLQRNGQKYIVQCKHWKRSKVGVQVVREQYGILTAEAAQGAFVVTSGVFTQEALDFAQDKDLILIDGAKLKEIIRQVAAGKDAESVESTVPSCPHCSSPMVKKLAKQGVTAGSEFWGCPRYPKCKGTLSI